MNSFNHMVKIEIDHILMAEVIFNHVNMMFIEFVKYEEMTIESLKEAVTRQITPIALLITADDRRAG